MIIKYQQVELGKIGLIKGGKRLPNDSDLTDIKTSHPYIRARDIRNGKINFDDPKYLTDDVFSKISRYTVCKGDVVITIVGANISDVAYIDDQFDGANLTENAVKITAKDQVINPKFLKYALVPSYMKEFFQIVASGAAQGKLGLYKVKSAKIPLPSIPEQQKISTILSAYDDLIENNLRRIKLLEEMAQITYEEWFVRLKFPGHETTPLDSATGLPVEWEETACSGVMDILSGGTPKTDVTEYWDGNIKFFTPKDAANCVYTLETEKTITELGLKKCNSKLYPKNTIFITARGTVGKLNLAREAMAMNQSCYALIAKNGLSQLFLFCALNNAIGAFKGAANGGVFDAIVVDTFRYMSIVKPDESLIDQFNSSVMPIFEGVENLIKQNQLLKEARDILLPRLMTGMIDVEQLVLPNDLQIEDITTCDEIN